MPQTPLYDLFVFAGEQSADAHGSAVLKALAPSHLKICGVGGPKLRDQGIDLILPMEEFEVMGFTDVIKALPRLRRHFKTVLNRILELQPKLVLLIDYPGFNLRLAKKLRKSGYTGKIVQYISPSVWAWKKKRALTMAQNYDLLLSIFPFEKEFFAGTQLPVEYVGNPTLDEITSHTYNTEWKKNLNLSDQPILSLFPGSRESEIIRNLPDQLTIAHRLKEFYPNLQICISVANPKSEKLILSKHLHDATLIPVTLSYELMRESHMAIAKCGTVTLELALHETPTLVTYKLSKLNAFLAQYIFRIKLPFYSLANILKKQEVFPEFIYKDFDSENTHLCARKIFEDSAVRSTCIQRCKQIQDILRNQNASRCCDNAAHAILKELA